MSMPEGSFDNPPDLVPKPESHSRRTVIKATAAASIAAPILGEIAREQEGVVDTPHGTFLPMYEMHNEDGVMEVKLPDNINGYFREAEFGAISQLFEAKPFDILYGQTNNEDNPRFQHFIIPEHILEVLSREQIPVIFGDVQIPDQSLYHSDEVLLGGVVATGTSLADRLLVNLAPQRYNRRKLLRFGGVAATSYALSPLFGDSVVKPLYESQQNEAVKAIAREFQAVQSSIHPEDKQIFFRNIIMADKMLTAAEFLEKKSGNKPRIAFEVGAAHKGIEYFLLAGREVCRRLIALYPKSTLEEIVKLNNGPEDFSSLRIITASGDERTLYQDPGRIQSEKVTDTALRDTIQIKLQY